MKSIVFGGTGFIGSHLVEQLLLAGQDVTAVVRRGSNTDWVSRTAARICEIDFGQYSQIVDVIEGHQLVFNCLANTKLHQSLDGHRAVEVELTGQLLNAACDADARRFIQLSTVQVYGFARPPIPIDEDYPCEASYKYNQVAQEREQAVKAIAEKRGIELVVARPVNTMGKRDSSSKQIFSAHRAGLMVVFGDGKNRFSCVDTRDVGRALAWLGTLPEAAGKTYLISGYETTWLEVKEALDQQRGKAAILVRIPAWLGKFIAFVLEIVTPYSKDLSLVPFSVAVMSKQTLFDDSRIRTAGFSPEYHKVKDTIDTCLSAD